MTPINENISIFDVLSHYNVVGMAIAVAIGIAGKDLVFSLSDDVIMPVLNWLTLNKFKFFKNNPFEPNKFISAFITFVLVTFTILIVMYTALKPMVKQEIIANRRKEANDDHIADNVNTIVKKLN